MKYTVLILRDANRDHAKIVDYIARRSSRGAKAWANAFERAVRDLAENADACPLAAEIDDLGFEAREMLFKTRRGRPYRILFTIRENDDEVVVLRIRGPGQNFVDPMDIPDPH